MTEFCGMVTAAPCMIELFGLLTRVARTNSNVLIRGATGTGKALVARALHELGPRSGGPFMAANCATLTPELLASELFGHVRGAFAGASRDRQGLFARADRGTIFLDEIAETPLDIQARLLGLLQQRSFVPLGGIDPVTVDVRLVSATNVSLRDQVAERRFREDLMYCVRVVSVDLPPLHRRDGDVQLFTWRFIEELNARGDRTIESIDPDAMQALLTYTWPGNVRELRNNIEHAFAVGEGPTLRLGDLTFELRGVPPPGGALPLAAASAANSNLEAERIREALAAVGGRKGEAAQRLGMSRSKLWRKMREYRLG